MLGTIPSRSKRFQEAVEFRENFLGAQIMFVLERRDSLSVEVLGEPHGRVLFQEELNG